MEIRILGRQVLSIKKEQTNLTENKIEPLKLRTPADKVKPAAEYTQEGYATGTYANSIGHARRAVEVWLHGGELATSEETAAFLFYVNGKGSELEVGLRPAEIEKVRAEVKAIDDKITPLPTKTVEQKTYLKPCGCISTAPLGRITIDGLIRCSKHGSYVRNETGKWVPTAKKDIGNIPSGRTSW
jgi:hypothetical protein